MRRRGLRKRGIIENKSGKKQGIRQERGGTDGTFYIGLEKTREKRNTMHFLRYCFFFFVLICGVFCGGVRVCKLTHLIRYLIYNRRRHTHQFTTLRETTQQPCTTRNPGPLHREQELLLTILKQIFRTPTTSCSSTTTSTTTTNTTTTTMTKTRKDVVAPPRPCSLSMSSAYYSCSWCVPDEYGCGGTLAFFFFFFSFCSCCCCRSYCSYWKLQRSKASETRAGCCYCCCCCLQSISMTATTGRRL